MIKSLEEGVFQSTRLRKARRPDEFDPELDQYVSIHAPA